MGCKRGRIIPGIVKSQHTCINQLRNKDEKHDEFFLAMQGMKYPPNRKKMEHATF